MKLSTAWWHSPRMPFTEYLKDYLRRSQGMLTGGQPHACSDPAYAFKDTSA